MRLGRKQEAGNANANILVCDRYALAYSADAAEVACALVDAPQRQRLVPVRVHAAAEHCEQRALLLVDADAILVLRPTHQRAGAGAMLPLRVGREVSRSTRSRESLVGAFARLRLVVLLGGCGSGRASASAWTSHVLVVDVCSARTRKSSSTPRTRF